MPTLIDLLNAISGGQQLPQAPRPAPSAEIPLAPVTNLGPLSGDTALAFGAANPEPVPPTFTQPAAPDINFVNQYAGAAPTAPVQRQPGRLETLAAILSGVGAGLQGQGPQFVQNLIAQREAPIRQYEQQRAQYEERRTRGLELAERRAEREAEQANRALESQYDREWRQWLARNADRSDEQKIRMQQVFTLQRDARQAQLEEERAQQRERRQREEDARTTAVRLGTGPGAAPVAIAKELGRYYANLTDKVSPAAANWVNAQARRAEILARGESGARVAASRREELNLQRQIAAAAKGINDIEALAQKAMETTEDKRGPILNRMRAMAVNLAAQFPDVVEVGQDNGWPFARLRPRGSVPQQQQAAQPQGPTDAEVQAYATQFNISPEKARRELSEMRRQ